MAESKDINLDNCIKKSNDIHQQFLSSYKDISQSVSESCFQILPETFPQHKSKLPIDLITKEFQESLNSLLEAQFNIMWNDLDIGEHITALEMLKDATPDKTKKQWRPSGQMVEEQTRGQRIRILLKKKTYFEKQLDFQKPCFDESTHLVNTLRKEHRQLAESNKDLLQEIKNKTAAVDGANKEALQMIQELLNVFEKESS